MKIELTQDEHDGLLEAIDLAISDMQEYLQNGSPHKDYGDEWPDVAVEKGRRFDGIAALCLKIGAEQMWIEATAVADNMRASGKEYRNAEFGN